jgi:hypothetical protein
VAAVADVGYLKLDREPEDPLIGIARMEMKFGLVASARRREWWSLDDPPALRVELHYAPGGACGAATTAARGAPGMKEEQGLSASAS